MPDLKFVNSPKSEEERLKYTRQVIGEGFYQKHGFVVLPAMVKGVDPNALVIYPEKMDYESVGIEKYQREWQRIDLPFWDELEQYLPGCREIHGSIEVRITRYGTVSSSGARIGEKRGNKGIYYLRADVDLAHLAAMIINNFLYTERKNLGITWSKREALMDFIMTRPPMRKLFPNFRPVMSELSRVPAKIRRESDEYIRDLGIRGGVRDLEIMGNKIVCKGEVVSRELSSLEKKVLKLLTEHQGELVSYDELADAVWGVGEFKTFWAINKLVERLRVKLDKLGIAKERIESVRGQGYLLQ